MTALRAPRTHLHTLKNGVRLAVTPLRAASRAHVAVFVGGGPLTEDDSTWGITHLAEHMVFRGTPRHRSVRDVVLAADDFGGDVGAATYHDRIVFDSRVDADRVADALHLMGDLVHAPRMRGLEIERDIILEEIADLFDDDGRDIDADNSVFRAAFAGMNLSRSIEGTPKALARYTRADVARHWRRLAVGDNVVVSVAGAVDAASVVRAATRAFGPVAPGPRPAHGAPPAAVRRRSPVDVVHTEHASTSVRLCLRAPGANDGQAPTLTVLARLLDDGPASRLQERIVDRDGMAYAVWALLDPYADASAFELGAEAQPGKLGAVARALARELRALATQAPRNDEVRRIAARVARDVRDMVEDPAAVADAVGRGVLLGSPFRPARLVAAVAAVDAAAVRACAGALVRSSPPVAVVLGQPRRTDVAAIRRAVAAWHR